MPGHGFGGGLRVRRRASRKPAIRQPSPWSTTLALRPPGPTPGTRSTRCHQPTIGRSRYPEVRRASAGNRLAMPIFPPIGIRTRSVSCQASWHRAENPTSSRMWLLPPRRGNGWSGERGSGRAVRRILRAANEGLPQWRQASAGTGARRLYQHVDRRPRPCPTPRSKRPHTILPRSSPGATSRSLKANRSPRPMCPGCSTPRCRNAGSNRWGSASSRCPTTWSISSCATRRATFTAYVPPGSVAKGKALVRTGGAGKTLACAGCHGEDLKGVGPMPGIAGRSPTYLVRQLYDFKHSARAGPSSALMKPAVAQLADEDMLSIVAILATLPP